MQRNRLQSALRSQWTQRTYRTFEQIIIQHLRSAMHTNRYMYHRCCMLPGWVGWSIHLREIFLICWESSDHFRYSVNGLKVNHNFDWLKFFSKTNDNLGIHDRKVWRHLQSTAYIKIQVYCTSVRMSAGIPVDISILQSNRNNPKKRPQLISHASIHTRERVQ